MKRAFSIAILLLCVYPLFARENSAPKPNVLFIAIDDLRDWTGYLGHNPQTKTPNIDKLAARGVWFTRSYCAAPECNPSRAALMSGLRPFTTGVYNDYNDWRRVIPEDLPLTTTFRKAGYYVCGAGKIYHKSYNRLSEWDDYLADEGTDPEPTGNTGVDGIKFAPLNCADEDLRDWKIVRYAIEQLQKKHDKPLFLAVGLRKPRRPWNVPRKYYDMHPLAEIKLPPYLENDLDDLPSAGVRMAEPKGIHAKILKSGRWKDAIQGYLAAISYCDAMVGRLLDAFDKSEQATNTIICFWSDHGWHLGEKHHWRKFVLWEEATRSPLIWVVPGVTKPNTRCDRTVDFMTIYPTLTDLCGIPTPRHVQGESIRALLANPEAAWNKPAITTSNFQNHAVRTEDWRYIHYADISSEMTLSGLLRRFGLGGDPTPANGGEELYDETKDPNEWTNLAGKAEFEAQKKSLMKFLPAQNTPDIGGERDAE